MQKVSIITGLAGQDGSILAEQLLEKGYKVYGVIRRSSRGLDLGCAVDLEGNPDLEVIEADLLDLPSLTKVCKLAKADEFYNLAAQSVHPQSILPMWTTSGIKFPTIEKLWSNMQAKNSVRTERDHQGLEIEIIDLPTNTQTKVLGYWNGMGTWKPIKQISRHKYQGDLVQMTQKFGRVILTPNHSALDTQGNTFRPEENKTLLAMRKLNWIRSSFAKEIRFNNRSFCKIDDIERIVRFIAFFIAEGWTSYNKANGGYIIGICSQQKSELFYYQDYLENITGTKWHLVEGKKEGYKSVWQLTTSNKELFKWLRKYCGKNSSTKKIPSFVFHLDKQFQQQFLDVLIKCDGCYQQYKTYSGLRYTTKSERLTAQLSFLLTQLKYDYTINCEDTEKATYYHFDECQGYQPNQGENIIHYVPFDGYVYDISVPDVTNFTIGLGNIVVHNSHVGTSFSQPVYTAQCTGLGVLNCLEAIRETRYYTKFYQASSSELFGGRLGEVAYNEQSAFYPRSPYGVAKLFGHWITINYRESYKLFACTGILHNHESERRGPNFVTRKISLAVANIKAGKQDKLYLGNLEAKRDWGYAADFTRGMWMMLQHHTPDDYVLATGETHSVREFCDLAFSHVDLDYRDYVVVDPQFYRPCEVDILVGDYSKAKQELGWEPQTTFPELVKQMVDHDLALVDG